MFTDLLSPAELAFMVLIGIPALLGLVNMIKDLGLPPRQAGPVAVVLGVLVMVSYATWGENRLFLLALVGILVGLGVTGYYDLTRLIGQKAAEIPPATITLDDSWDAAQLPPVEDPEDAS